MYFLEPESRKDQRIYNCLFKVDFNTQKLYHSFTFLHWSLIEQIVDEETYIENVEEETFEKLIYCILPGGNTILHILAEDKDQETILKIFSESHKNGEVKYHIPFTPNFEGLTPLHIIK